MPTPEVGLADSLFTTPTLISAGGWLVVVVLVIVAMVRGWLVPGSQVDRLVTSYQQQVADWRETSRIEAARGDLLANNQERLLEASLSSHRLLEATNATVQRIAKASGVDP